ncbi:MAG: DUF885 domain-containing protein [Gemmatimonadota bacterium]|nr:DUF885 domain-containing protein [Gemmatimonadota bacterium]
MHRRLFLHRTGQTALALGLLPHLSACGMRKAAGSDRPLNALRDRYFLKTLELNPVTATYLGGDGYDPSLAQINGRLRDWRPEALEVERNLYWEIESARQAIDPASLSPSARIDHAVLGAQLAFLLHQSGDLRTHERIIDTYVAEPFRGIDWQIQGMTETDGKTVGRSDGQTVREPDSPTTRGTESEWILVLERLRGTPSYLETAQANLLAGKKAGNLPDHRMIERDGVGGAKANADYFRKAFPESVKIFLGDQPFAAALLPQLADTARIAADAWERFAGFLLQTYDQNDLTDRYAAGEEEYAWRLKHCLHLTSNTEDLFAYGAAQVAAFETQLFQVAEEAARDAGLALSWASDADRRTATRAVMEALGKDSPANDDELFQWYRQAGERAVAYGREQNLFDIPADYRLEVTPTPPVLRSTIDASYYPAPPFKTSGVGRFFLTPTGNDPATLRENNRASVADTAIHEGFPGHDWHYKYMTQHAREISNIRWLTPGAVEDSSSMWEDSMAAEGWALYAEELMAQPVAGRPHGFYTAAEHLYELQGQLLRAVRVRVDVGIHTGRMTFNEAVDYFVEHVAFYPGARLVAATDPTARALTEGAQRAMYRYSKWPTQAITYNLGKSAILDLRDALKLKEGTAFSGRAFHERLMRMGTIPAGYFRDEFLAGTV